VLNPCLVSLPEREKRPKVVAANRPKPLKQWLLDLPIDNEDRLPQLVFERIREINQSLIGVRQLTSILDRLQPVYSTIHRLLTSHIFVDGFPISSNKQKTVDLLIAITKEFAISYYFVLNAHESKKIPWLPGKVHPRQVLRLIQTYTDIQVLHYLLYIDDLRWIWLDINSIYRFALKHEIEGVQIAEPLLTLKKKTTIQETYNRILLLRITDPYRFTQTEVVYLNTIMERWDDLVMLTKYRSNNPQASEGWMIDLDQDEPPFWVKYPNKADIPINCFQINVQGLLSLFEQHQELVDPTLNRFGLKLIPNEGEKLLPRYFFNYLKNRWSGLLSENSTYFGDCQEQLISVGLKTIHQQFSTSGGAQNTCVSEPLATPISEYELYCKFDQPGQIAVCSLLGYKPVDGHTHSRSLGIVNRISRKNPSDPIKFEITCITTRSFPAGVQPLKSNKNSDVYQRALLYYKAAKGKKKTMLIVESKHLKNNDVIRILVQNKSYTVKLVSGRQINSECHLFVCQGLKKR